MSLLLALLALLFGGFGMSFGGGGAGSVVPEPAMPRRSHTYTVPAPASPPAPPARPYRGFSEPHFA